MSVSYPPKNPLVSLDNTAHAPTGERATHTAPQSQTSVVIPYNEYSNEIAVQMQIIYETICDIQGIFSILAYQNLNGFQTKSLISLTLSSADELEHRAETLYDLIGSYLASGQPKTA